ncbi:MAG: zinc ribbon domain-containing protein [Desulfatirhabdiaceae bacterium]
MPPDTQKANTLQAFCTRCGASVSTRAKYCSQCGHNIAVDGHDAALSMADVGGDGLVWDMEIPLLNGRDILGGVLKIYLLSFLIVGGLLTVVFGSQGEWDVIAPMLGVLSIVTCGILGVSALVMALVFRNRLRVRYTLGPEGICLELIDTRARLTNRLLFWLGILTGRPQAIGTALIAQSQETVALAWGGSFTAVYDPKRFVITLKNRWRKLMVVHCTPQNYAPVATIITRELAAHGTIARHLKKKSPLPRLFGLSVLTVGACVPAFLLSEAFHVSLLLPILLLCFSITTIWLVPLFGYVNLGLVGFHVCAVLMDAFREQRSYFDPADIYQRWTVYDSNDWALMVLAGLGFAWLIFFSVGAIRGRFQSAFVGDMIDMGE